MVVEDEPNIYDLLMAMFELWGIDGLAFVDGEEAVAWVEQVDSGRYQGEMPELALIDIRLPGIGGGEVAARIRRSQALHPVAIVLTSAYLMNGAELDALMAQAQADAFIRKPLPGFTELQRRFHDIIDSRQRLLASPALPTALDSTRPASHDESEERPLLAPQHHVLKTFSAPPYAPDEPRG